MKEREKIRKILRFFVFAFLGFAISGCAVTRKVDGEPIIIRDVVSSTNTATLDLVAMNFDVNDIAEKIVIRTGASIDLDVTVSNQGVTTSSVGMVKYYWSTQSVITTNDNEVARDSFTNLAANETSDHEITVPVPTMAGPYYYGACVEVQDDEGNVDNNCSSVVAVDVVLPSDLVAINFDVNDGRGTVNIVRGESLDLDVTVRNEGIGSSLSGAVRYYRSTDSIITVDDSEIGSDNFTVLAVNEISDEEITTLTAPVVPGTYYYGACVDVQSNESDVSNNCSSGVRVNVSLPADLVAVDFDINDSAGTVNIIQGDSLDLDVTVQNNGGASSLAGVVRYYRSTDSSITPSDTEMGMDNFTSLSVNGTSDEEITLIGPSTDGTYYYGACVEVQSDEGNVDNNCSSGVRVDVSLPADLVAMNFDVNDSTGTVDVLPGESLDLDVTVQNNGGSSSSAGVVKYYRSTDSNITTGDTEMGTDNFTVLAVNEISDEEITITGPSTAGTYYYGACVEVQSDEGNVDNNCSSGVRVNVIGPDLVVTSFKVNDSTGPVNVIKDQGVNLAVTILNQGTGSSAATTGSVAAGFIRYYVSPDNVITDSDHQISTDSFSSLAAGARLEEDNNTTFGSDATYYLGACVDVQSNESDSSNNCSSAVTVVVR